MPGPIIEVWRLVIGFNVGLAMNSTIHAILLVDLVSLLLTHDLFQRSKGGGERWSEKEKTVGSMDVLFVRNFLMTTMSQGRPGTAQHIDNPVVERFSINR